MRGSLLKHVGSIHENIEFPCDKCNYKATWRGSLLKHMRSNHSGFMFLCDQCDFKTIWRKSLMSHVESKHHNGDKGYNIQEKTEENILEQDDELTILDDTKTNYTCHICNVNSEDLSNYKVHLNSQMHKALSVVFT